MDFQSRTDLRKQIFEAMNKCSETRERFLENISQTRKLLTTLNAFYNPRPHVDDSISWENATDWEKEIVSVFINDVSHFPINFPDCNSLSDEIRRELAAGFASLSCELIPDFDTIRKFDKLSFTPCEESREELAIAVIDAMAHCSGQHCFLKDISDYKMTAKSLRATMAEALADLRNKFRANIFLAMRHCLNAANQVANTRRLMWALYKYYHPNPGPGGQITLENTTNEERRIISSFMNASTFTLPLDFGGLNKVTMYGLRRISEGLTALRIDFLPHFSAITRANFIRKLLYIGDSEDTIREVFFYRLFTKKMNLEDEDEAAPTSLCTKCTTAQKYWDRDTNGSRICIYCHLRMRLDTTGHGKFPLVWRVKNVLKYFIQTQTTRNDLGDQLSLEYSLTD